jgi:hypothetical protein
VLSRSERRHGFPASTDDPRSSAFYWSCLSFLLAWTTVAAAKPPTLDSLFPPGGQRGETVAVTAAGSFGQWPVRVWTEGEGISVNVLPEKGKLAIAVAPGARVGVHWLRLFDDEGATVLRPFLVGTLPEVLEAEPNDDPTKPQRLETAAVTVNGRLARSGDVDGFAMPLRKGQTLVAALEANRRLGAPMDGLLQVASAAGFVLAENDDAPDRDPLLAFQAPADGTYLVRVFAFPAEPDSRIGFSGGDAYIYRLTLTTAGYLDHVYPLALPRAASLRVEAAGWNIGEPARWLERDVPEAPGDNGDASEPRRITLDHPLLAGAGEVRLVPYEAAVETEPNTLEHPQDVALPITITGQIDPPRDQDVYRFASRKDEKWRFQVESRSLGQPLDAVLKIIDAAGKVLAEVDDPGSRRRNTVRDPELAFTAPADGSYRIVVRDLNNQGGFRHVYLLTVAAPLAADYTLTLAADQFVLAPGKPLKIPVTVTRDSGFNGTIDVGLEASSLPEGVTAPRVSSAPTGSTAKSVTFELTALTSQGPWSGPFRIIGRVNEAQAKPRPAMAPLVGSSAATDRIWLTVLKPEAPPKDAPAEKPAKPE